MYGFCKAFTMHDNSLKINNNVINGLYCCVSDNKLKVCDMTGKHGISHIGWLSNLYLFNVFEAKATSC